MTMNTADTTSAGDSSQSCKTPKRNFRFITPFRPPSQQSNAEEAETPKTPHQPLYLSQVSTPGIDARDVIAGRFGKRNAGQREDVNDGFEATPANVHEEASLPQSQSDTSDISTSLNTDITAGVSKQHQDQAPIIQKRSGKSTNKAKLLKVNLPCLKRKFNSSKAPVQGKPKKQRKCVNQERRKTDSDSKKKGVRKKPLISKSPAGFTKQNADKGRKQESAASAIENLPTFPDSALNPDALSPVISVRNPPKSPCYVLSLTRDDVKGSNADMESATESSVYDMPISPLRGIRKSIMREMNREYLIRKTLQVIMRMKKELDELRQRRAALWC